MRNVNIIVMGKTGAGKSTLINSVLQADVAPTGTGQAITKKNQVYSKNMLLHIGEETDNLGRYAQVGCKLNLYDTVGLEIDNTITEQTLSEIKRHIEITQEKMEKDDIHVVWFCVNNKSSRFERYELELIRKLSIDYEIPFIIVLTQCISDEEGELGIKLSNNLPEVLLRRVLAKNYKMRNSEIPSFGIKKLIHDTFNDYKSLKVDIIEKKLNTLNKQRIDRIKEIQSKGEKCISGYSAIASKIGIMPGGCIPIVHGMCIKMITDLNNIAGFSSGGNFADEVFADVIVGIIVTPFMAIPLLSIPVAIAYIETVGDKYLKAMINVIDNSTDQELLDNALMKKRLKEEMTNLKK